MAKNMKQPIDNMDEIEEEKDQIKFNGFYLSLLFL